MTTLACVERRAVLGSRTLAVGTCHEFGNLQFLVDTVHYVLKGHLDRYAQVSTLVDMLAGTASGGAAETAERIVSAEAASEYVSEMREDILHRHSAAKTAVAAIAARTAAESLRTHRMAELVISGAFVGIAQHVIRLGRFLEFLLGLLVSRILVGMILDGLFAVGFLYFIGCGVFRYAKHFIIISFLSHCDMSLEEA